MIAIGSNKPDRSRTTGISNNLSSDSLQLALPRRRIRNQQVMLTWSGSSDATGGSWIPWAVENTSSKSKPLGLSRATKGPDVIAKYLYVARMVGKVGDCFLGSTG